MSIALIHKYYKEVDDLILFGGADNEAVVSHKFGELIECYCRKRNNLHFIPQLSKVTKQGGTIRPDATLKTGFIECGYWESKANVSIDEEIRKKFNAGYPKTNILFEDSKTAILFQNGEEISRIDIRNDKELDKVLTALTTYEHPLVKNFSEAIEKFKENIPQITVSLKEMISLQERENKEFKNAQMRFLSICKLSINESVSVSDINEMLIQHILTEEIFLSVFNESQFHRENNIAKELHALENTFFTGNTKRQTLQSIKFYYEQIKATAVVIDDHHEKQKFLKSLYENFYKAYNPKSSDRLGVVYTPGEIVKFIISSIDILLQQHFSVSISSQNIDILDPATGTGTFICELIDYIPKQYLEYKYKNEIHANEISILPYYIANLNIEYTYSQKMQNYEEFQNLCFVDTLDNTASLNYEGKMGNIYGFSEENANRIKHQNKKNISVILGNPPYNATQKSENENNKNKLYKQIDERIKNSYVKFSKTQNLIKIYDMYARFFRWATDRIDEKGIVAFITNRSFIDSKTFDGFRKSLLQDFNYLYIIDLQGDIRADKTQLHANVFGIMTGVAIAFLVKNKSSKKNILKYFSENSSTVQEKFNFLRETNINQINFQTIVPDEKSNWLHNNNNDFGELLPLIDNQVKKGSVENALFKYFSLGSNSGADEWFWDKDLNNLKDKTTFMYNVLIKESKKFKGKNEKEIAKNVSLSIKWTRELRKVIVRGFSDKLKNNCIRIAHFRPFTKMNYYYEPKLLKCNFLNHKYFPDSDTDNKIIAISLNNIFSVLSQSGLVDLHFNGDSQCIPLYVFNNAKSKMYNLTDWGLEQFTQHYKTKKIKKEDIFHYVYGVLHNPNYRKKYELNLKREFPRIPFYKDFWQWAEWGKELMELHINYETKEPFELKIKNEQLKEDYLPKCKLKADKESGEIQLDDITKLTGIPKQAWDYKLGVRSAMEWILDQYKEKDPTDTTIKEKFNTYKFADYKDHVIDLLKRVCTVSVITVAIMQDMEKTGE